ncbi:hypothetical protein [uncultured Endozoicomonas sp.]|uniref:hypothetical protein n=1 Tax=uncultured Endozoicomonas sp. TaxID=432652 RepID=UPI002637B811|nr:hypothetical protein [uncultured Endozoicomonas sp.]
MDKAAGSQTLTIQPNQVVNTGNVPDSRLSDASHKTMGSVIRQDIAPDIPKKEGDGRRSAVEKRQRNLTVVDPEAIRFRPSSVRRDYSYVTPRDQKRQPMIAGGLNPEVKQLTQRLENAEARNDEIKKVLIREVVKNLSKGISGKAIEKKGTAVLIGDSGKAIEKKGTAVLIGELIACKDIGQRKLEQAIESLQLEVESQKQEIKRLKENRDISTSGKVFWSIDNVSEKLKTIREIPVELENVRKKIIDLSSQPIEVNNPNNLERENELDRLRSKEQKLVGKLDEYKEIKGPEFEVSQGGVRLVPSFCLNGSGKKEGKYMSFFCKIIPNEYMHFQKFPCEFSTKFSMLDQTGNQKHKTKKTDSKKEFSFEQYGKPQAGLENRHFGCERFAGQKKLTSDYPYVKNDSIFLSVEVKER